MEFPEDIVAKREALARHHGHAIRTSLIRAIEEMQKMERMGTKYPIELKDQLLLAAETNWDAANEKDHAHAKATIEAVKRIGKLKPLVSYEDDDVVMAKCQCVNGECLPGDSQCNHCYPGWKGRMCDIPDKSNKQVHSPEDSRMNGAHIDEDDDLEDIMHGKIQSPNRADHGDDVPSHQGRRFGQKDRVSAYKPRHEYEKVTDNGQARVTPYNSGHIDDDDVKPSSKKS